MCTISECDGSILNIGSSIRDGGGGEWQISLTQQLLPGLSDARNLSDNALLGKGGVGKSGVGRRLSSV